MKENEENEKSARLITESIIERSDDDEDNDMNPDVGCHSKPKHEKEKFLSKNQ